MNISTKQKQRHKHRQQMYGHQVGKGGGWDERKDWVDIYIYFSLALICSSQRISNLYIKSGDPFTLSLILL